MVKDMSPESQNLDYKQKLIRSFGRIKSRKLSSHKNFLLENIFESYKISQINKNISENSLCSKINTAKKNISIKSNSSTDKSIASDTDDEEDQTPKDKYLTGECFLIIKK